MIKEEEKEKSCTQDPKALRNNRDPGYEKRLIAGKRGEGLRQCSKDDTAGVADEKGCSQGRHEEDRNGGLSQGIDDEQIEEETNEDHKENRCDGCHGVGEADMMEKRESDHSP